MMDRMKNKRNSGFTLVETLATVAILVILLAVSAVSVINHIDVLKITELDNAARDIYMAAENRAVLLSAAQRLDDLVPMEDGEDGKEGNKVTPPAQTYAATPDDSLYYVSKNTMMGTAFTIKDLLIDGSVDSALLEGDFYIVYDMASGSVRDVFYAEKDGALAAIVENCTSGSSSSKFDDFYKDWRADRSARLDLKNDLRNLDETLVGHYSGAAAGGAAPWTEGAGVDIQEKPYINVAITNKEELTVTVTVKWDKSIDSAVRAAIKYTGLDGPKLSVKLNDIELANGSFYQLKGTGTGDGRVRGVDDGTGTNTLELYKIKTEGNISTYECTWVLDSLTGGKDDKPLQFKDLGSNITPGKDFTVKASIEPVDKDDINYSFIEASDEAKSNSLFEYWTESDGEVAHIAYLRHLQNLSAEDISANPNGYNSGVPTTEVDAATLVVTTAKDAKTLAIQTAKIWGDGNGGVEWDTGNHKPFEAFEETYNFVPIVNDALTSYTGLDDDNDIQYEIRKLTVSGGGNQGLFGQNSASCTIQNVIMVDGSVTGTGDNIGGIVGKNLGTVENCKFSGSVTGTDNVGGVAGYSSGTVKSSVNNSKVTGNKNVGGVVGSNGDAGYSDGKVLSCHNEGSVGVNGTDNARGSYVGGVVGYNNGSLGFDPDDNESPYYCSNSGVVMGTIRVGGVVGNVDSNGVVRYCYNTGNVTGGENVGGVAGYITNTRGSANRSVVEYCYNTGAVTGDGSYFGSLESTDEDNSKKGVGGVVGRSTGDVSDCYNAGPVKLINPTDTTVPVGGVVGLQSEGESTVSNTYSTSTNCYNYGNVSGPSGSKVGGVVGDKQSKDGADVTVTNCYYLKTNDVNKDLGGINGKDDDGAKPLSNAQFATEDSFKEWDFDEDGIWTLDCPYESEDPDNPDDICPQYKKEQANDMDTDPTRLSRPILVAIPEPDVPHAEGLIVGLVYYEDYGNGDYGVFGPDGYGIELDYNMKTDDPDDTRTIREFGYAVIFRAEDVGDADAVTVGINGKNETSVNDGENVWKLIDVDGTRYYIIPGLTDLRPDTTAVPDFYKYLSIGLKLGKNNENKTVEGEFDYYFNPHFAKTVIVAEEGKTAGDYAAPLKSGYMQKDDDPEPRSIIIRTPEQLDNLNGAGLGTAKYYNQSYAFHQELDLVLTEGSEANYAQTPIGRYYKDSDNDPFTGIYDGDGHTISGLSVTGTASRGYGQGLFAYLNDKGAVKNLTVKGTVTGSNANIGGIVGRSEGGTVENCHSYVTVIGGTQYTGGVVGYNSGTVEDCHSYATVTGNQRVGGVVGQNESSDSMVKNCSNAGSVTGTGTFVGGVVGYNVSGTVQSCYNTGNITGHTTDVARAGGVVGQNSGTVQHCYNTGRVEGYSHVGGVAGYNTSQIGYCYSIGEIEATNNSNVGGIVGFNNASNNNNPTVDNCYYLEFTASKSGALNSSTNVKFLDRDGFADWENNFAEWNNTDAGEVWTMDSNAPYINGYRPVLKAIPESYEGTDSDHAYIITNRLDLENVAVIVNAAAYTGEDDFYKLTADIDLHGGPGNQWTTLIGSSSNIKLRFNGTFDGGYEVEVEGETVTKNHTITGLYIESTASNQGLFGYNAGTIQNVTVEGDVTGGSNVGGIVGYNIGTVENCRYSGSVSGTSTVGGIVGRNESSGALVIDCVNETNEASLSVNGGTNVGGIVGHNIDGGRVENCGNKSTVSGTSGVGGIVGRNESSGALVIDCVNETNEDFSVSGGGNVGGVVGLNNTGGRVENCGNKSTVSGTNNVGGIVGYNANGGAVALTEDCGNEGGVTGTGSSVGGIVGNNYNGSTVTLESCVNKGDIRGTDQVGGIVGNNSSGSTVTLESCVNEGGVTGTNGSASGGIGGIVGLNAGNDAVENCVNEGEVEDTGSGNSNVGGIVGYNANTCTATLEGCVNNNTVTGSAAGGIVGRDYRTVALLLCANTGSVNGSSFAGGIVGIRRYGPVEESYNTGTVTGSTAGGIAGLIEAVNNLKNCYNTGGVSGTTAGGVVGDNRGVNNTVENCYNTGGVSGTTAGGVVGNNAYGVTHCYYLTNSAPGGINGANVPGQAEVKTVAEFADMNTFTEWDQGIWEMSEPAMRPILTNNLERDVYMVIHGGDADGLLDALKQGGDTVLGGDVDYGGGTFEPIGEFTGTFDGNGHTISGLNVEDNGDSVGFFEEVGRDGIVRNLHIVATVKSTGDWAVTGGIAGTNYGTIENCSISGTVTAEKRENAGGIVGDNYGTVKNCYSTAMIKGGTNNSSVGGIVGCNQRGTVENCYNTGEVDGTGRENAGGIVGYNKATVRNCYNIGNVHGASWYNDGIVFNGTVTNCYYITGGSLGNGTAKSSGDFANQNTFTGWDFENTWTMGEFPGEPVSMRPVLQSNPETDGTKTIGMVQDRAAVRLTAGKAASAPETEAPEDPDPVESATDAPEVTDPDPVESEPKDPDQPELEVPTPKEPEDQTVYDPELELTDVPPKPKDPEYPDADDLDPDPEEAPEP